jgi:nucleoid-associated protein YgaU
MAAGAVSLDVMMNLVFGAISGDREARRQLDKLHAETTASGMARGAKDSKKVLESEWGPTFKKLTKAGMRAAGEELQEASTKAARDQMTAMMKIANLERRIQGEKRDAEKKKLIAEKAALQKSIKAEQWAQEKRLKIAEKEAEKILDLRKRRMEEISKDYSEKMKDTGENLANVIEMGFSADNIDAKGLTEGIGKMLGSGLSKGASMMSGVAGGGKAAAMLASSATALAGVVAPIAALVGVFAAATGQATEMNKAFLASSSAADILGENTQAVKAMGVEYGALNFRLKMLRRVAIDTATDFRMSKEEVTSYITSLNEAGITTSEFRGIVKNATNDMDAYRSVTRAAIVASQGLGISAAETGDFMNKMTRDMGGDLTDVQGAFGMIFSEARKAGMSTKDFFTAINEASSGMALYNFRVADTVGLFTDLVEILGEDLAKQQLGLEGTFRGMGMQERVKTTMLMGTGTAQKIAQADLAAQAKVFSQTLSDKGINIPELGDLTDPTNLAKLGGMSGEDFRKVYAKVSDPAAKRQLISMRELAKAQTGGFMNVAASLGSLSKTGEMAAQLSQGQALLGGKAISEASGMQVMMLQEALGISGEQFEVLRRLDIGLRSEFEQMRANAKEGDEILGKSFEEALAGGLLSQSKTLEASAELQYTMMERAALDQLQETRSMSQTMSNVIASKLEDIYLGMEHAVEWLKLVAKALDPLGLLTGVNEQEERSKEMALVKTSRDQAQKDLERLDKDILAKKAELDVASKPEERARLKDELAAMEEEKRLAQNEVRGRKRQMELMVGGKSKKEALETVTGELQAERREEGIRRLSGGTGLITRGGETIDTSTLSDEQKDLLIEQIEGEKAAEMERKRQAEEQLKEEEESTKAIVKAIETMDQRQARAELEARYGREAVAKAAQGDTEALYQAIEAGGITEGEASLLGRAGLISEQAQKSGRLMSNVSGSMGLLTDPTSPGESPDLGESLGDFIYRGDGTRGTINPIDSADQFFGAKPGGPIDKAMGSKTVNISINGGDEARVYNVVKRVLRDSGYGDVKRY